MTKADYPPTNKNGQIYVNPQVYSTQYLNKN